MHRAPESRAAFGHVPILINPATGMCALCALAHTAAMGVANALYAAHIAQGTHVDLCHCTLAADRVSAPPCVYTALAV